MVIKVESLPPLLDANQQKYFDELRQMRAAETNGALPLAPKIGTREALREEYYNDSLRQIDAELDELLKLPSWTVDTEARIKELQVLRRDLRVSFMNEDIGNNVESQGTSTQEGDNKSQLTSTFGASKTNPNAISSSLGALSPANLDEIMRTVKQHMGTRPKANPWLTSLEFFANMAAAASQPGATALGAAGTAGATTVKTLLEERKAKRAEELAATQMGLTLAATLGKRKAALKFDKGEEALYMSEDNAKAAYPPKQYGNFWKKFSTTNENLFGKPILSTGGRPQLVKRKYSDGVLVPGGSTLVPSTTAATQAKTISGDIAVYMSPGDAKHYITKVLGLGEDHADYNRVFDFIATNDTSKHGQSAERGGAHIEIKRRIGGNGQMLGVSLTPATGAGEPFGVGYRKKQGEAIVKDRARYYDNIANVLPRLATVKTLLLDGAKTGVWQEATSGFRGLLVSAFGTADPDLRSFETLQSASFYIATKMRPKGSGSTSDMEFKAYQKAGLSTANTPFSNYISIWQMERAIHNAQAIDDVVLEMLDAESSPKEIRKAIEDLDNGFYEKFESTGLDRTDENIQEWWDDLEVGAVVFNRGNLITGPGGRELGMFVVKMPDGTVGSKFSGFGGR